MTTDCDVLIDQSPDGRWWVSYCGHGRPVGMTLDEAYAHAELCFPGKKVGFGSTRGLTA